MRALLMILQIVKQQPSKATSPVHPRSVVAQNSRFADRSKFARFTSGSRTARPAADGEFVTRAVTIATLVGEFSTGDIK